MDTVTSFFSGGFAYAFTWTIVNSLWQCALVAAGLAISLRINRNQTASIRNFQALAALVLCLTISILTFIHYHQLLTTTEHQLQGYGSVFLTYNDSIWQHSYLLLNNNIDLILTIWVLGFSLQVARYVNDFTRAQLLRHQGSQRVAREWQKRFNNLAEEVKVKKAFLVKESTKVTSICVIGHWKPIVLLPIGLLTNLSVDEVEALMLHEFAHIKRNDYLANAIQCLIQLFFFFNPAVVWISRQIDIERENACDDFAVKHCGNPALFARSLANISELELRLISVMAAKSNRRHMLPRVKRLFSNSSGVAKSLEQAVTAICAGLLIVAMNVSAREFDLPNIPTLSPATATDTSRKPAQAETAEIPASIDTPTSLPETPQAKTVLPVTNALNYAQKQLTPAKRNTVAKLANSKPKHTLLAQTDRIPSKGLATEQDTRHKLVLEPMKVPHFNQFYIASNLALPVSRKIYVDMTNVRFADVWLNRFRTATTDSYRQTIFNRFGETYTELLKEELSRNGWQIMDKPDKETLRLRPQLIDLYIYAPETSGVKVEIIAQAGQSGTELLFETPNGVTFMRIIDYRSTGDTIGGVAEANRATNFFYFKKLMQAWSNQSVFYLERVISIVESQNSRNS